MKKLLIVGAFSVGCGSANEGIATTPTALERDHGALTVMTRNVYLGADVDPILSASTPEEVPVAVAGAWAQLEANDFSARAKALAKEIASKRPHLVGLQEVALFRRFSASSGAMVEVDFLELLKASLLARGLAYEVAVVQTDSDVSMPLLAGFDAAGAPILDGVQMIDREVVLVRKGVSFSQAKAARYAVGLPVAIAGGSVEIVRGWASVVAQTEHGPVRFVTTHLEDHVAEVQLAQAAELLALLGEEKLPVIVVGDFNSPVDGSQTATYATIAAAGYRDAWSAIHPKEPGFTCCQAADLHTTQPFYERLDLVFVRAPKRALPIRSASLVGNQVVDRTGSGLWPSDHAGVVVTFGDD